MIMRSAYISGERHVFTTSPIYGHPGIFILNCKSGNVAQIVKPKNIDKSYPYGADYFELSKIEKGKVFFYYSANVDQTDFNSFRSKKNLRAINLPIK